jgi:rubrerythrin
MFAGAEAALEMERKGAAFYEDMAKRATHPLAKELFAMLAVEERVHETVFAGIAAEHALPALPSQPGVKLESRVQEIFRRLGATAQPAAGKAEGLETAMQLERDSYAYYQKQSEEADGEPAAKRFFEALMRQELDHFVALENIISYLEHPGDWFMSEESQRWNWMNT